MFLLRLSVDRFPISRSVRSSRICEFSKFFFVIAVVQMSLEIVHIAGDISLPGVGRGSGGGTGGGRAEIGGGEIEGSFWQQTLDG